MSKLKDYRYNTELTFTETIPQIFNQVDEFMKMYL
jgi:hypothetical protein